MSVAPIEKAQLRQRSDQAAAATRRANGKSRSALIAVALFCHAAAAQEGAGRSENERFPQVAAVVDGQEILVGEVDREVAKVVQDREVTPRALAALQAQALQQLIGRRLVLKYLTAAKLGPTNEELEAAITRIGKQLKKQGLTLGAYLQSANLTESQFRHAVAWEIAWKSYLDAHLTDHNLRNYFDKHRREFDGTHLRVSQVLFKVQGEDKDLWDAALRQARQLRASIVDGSISFAQAARDRSQAPSAQDGGDIGLISRHEPMPEAFSRAAFDLKEGEVSQPVTTAFGVHLILCTEVKPGQKSWQDVRPQLRAAAARFLFDWIVGTQQDDAEIRFTGNLPHFRPGSREVAR